MRNPEESRPDHQSTSVHFPYCRDSSHEHVVHKACDAGRANHYRWFPLTLSVFLSVSLPLTLTTTTTHTNAHIVWRHGL